MTQNEAIELIESTLRGLGVNPNGNLAAKDAYYMAVQLGYDIRWKDLPQGVVTIPQLAKVLTDLDANCQFIDGDERHVHKVPRAAVPMMKKREASLSELADTCRSYEPRDLIFLMVVTPGENERRLVAAILSEGLGPLL